MKFLNTLKDMEKELYFANRTMLTGDALKKFKKRRSGLGELFYEQWDGILPASA